MLRRLWHDAGPRMLVSSALVAALAGGYVAFG
jgi:hypothetical protein